jgi:septal ring-binding cell division protein DamX
MEEAPVAEVGPMEGVRSVERVTMYEAVSAAMEYGRRTKAATVDRHPTTSETAAVKGRAATAEAAAMKCRSAAAETTAAVKRRAAAPESAAMEAAATKTSAATTAKTATATAAPTRAVLDFGRQSIGCVLRSRSRAGTCE